MTLPSLTHFKRCTKCRCTKPAGPLFFRRWKRSKSGLHPACKTCDLMYRRANKAAIAEKDRRNHLANRVARLDQMRVYREQNKEHIAECNRSYGEKNKEKRRAYYKRWSKNNQDIRRAHKRKRQAAKKNDKGFRNVHELWEMYHSQDGLCAYCEVPLFGNFHVDHMQPLSRGGADNPDNYAITCPTCNLRKHSKTTIEFVSTLGYKVV